MVLVKRSDVSYVGEGPSIDELDPDVIYEKFRGEKIGAGCSKTAYVVNGRPDLAVIKGKNLRLHMTDLQYLADMGVPTATYDRIGASDTTALVKRFPAASKGNGIRDHANRKTVEDFVGISRTLRKAGVFVQDFQVFVDHDGSMVVYDPLDLEIFGRGSTKNNKDGYGWYNHVLNEMGQVLAKLDGGTWDAKVEDLKKLIVT